MDIYDIELLREGNLPAFKNYFILNYPKLMGFACRYVDRQTAEDIVQDVFITIWENKNELQINNLMSFLLRSVQNRCLNHLKHRTVVENYEVEVRIAKERLAYIIETTDGNAIYSHLIKKDLLDIIKGSFNKLSYKCAKACYLYYFQDFNVKEIAEMLQVSPRTVEGYFYQALIILRKEFKSIGLCILMLFGIF